MEQFVPLFTALSQRRQRLRNDLISSPRVMRDSFFEADPLTSDKLRGEKYLGAKFIGGTAPTLHPIRSYNGTEQARFR